LAVRPELCRQGIASALISHVLQLAQGKRVAVQTAKLNTPAICLYKKFGFTEKETRTSPEGVVLISFEKCNTQ
jgi:ribosomal protein S18 acetylase RimI-like enzyme